jgi:predicted kinase
MIVGRKVNRLILVSGPPGVGKSSLSIEIAKKLHSTLLDKDCIDEPFSPDDRGSYYTKNIEPKVITSLLNLSSLNFKAGNDVVIDLPWTHIFINSPKIKKQVLDFVSIESISLKIIELSLSEELLKKRLQTRNLKRDQWKFSDSGWEKFKEVDKILSVNPLDHLLIDTSQSINTNLTQILDYISS